MITLIEEDSLLSKKLPGAIEIKGYRNDVNIILNNEVPFSDIEAELVKRLEGSGKFFSGLAIVLNTGNRVVDYEECERLKEILSDRFSLTVSTVRTGSDETRKAAEKVGWEVAFEVEPDVESSEPDKGEIRTLAVRENDTVLIKRTLRSGQKERHRGNIVIIGDVNPGAEVVATGDVVIMGVLRGLAHAGAEVRAGIEGKGTNAHERDGKQGDLTELFEMELGPCKREEDNVDRKR